MSEASQVMRVAADCQKQVERPSDMTLKLRLTTEISK